MDQNYSSNQRSFWQFSDQLRLQTATLANLSTNDSIWSNSFVSGNNHNSFDVRVGAELGSSNSTSKLASNPNTFINDGWNSFKTFGSDILSGNTNPKPLGSGNSFKNPVNDYEMWNNFKAGTGSDLIGSSLNSKQLGSSNTNVNDLVNDFGTWNSFKPGLGSNLLNPKPNPIGSGTSNKDPINEYGLWSGLKAKTASDYNGFNDGWKINNGTTVKNQNPKEIGINNGGGNYSKGLYYKLGTPANGNGNLNWKNYRSGGEEAEHGGGKGGKKGNKGKNENGTVEKRFKTLPAAEALPRNERIGGYVFVCNNETMAENLKRQLFGLPPRYRDSVRAITPGLPLFLYNYSTHQLHGVFEAVSFGGTNIDPTAWEDKKCPGESRFPAQVRVIRREVCEPLEEDSFRPILHHYDGPKFRLELSVPEAISLLDVLSHQNS
ncbi:hyphally regulated cell wall protein 3-like [Cucurbita maxima]|uniref:Hyphally regulated cell wall protein 3-like n=1 Tax=Cucurbita maxima TaxID=3661 RepID=A0A6J1HY09_CUCMA|nr:hyphally regulated cell wall protein 3-like [Cucurbita maxima]